MGNTTAPGINKSLNDFSLNLFRLIAASTPQENVVVSPYSVSSALAIALNGAHNETLAEMLITLNLPANTQIIDINSSFLNTKHALKSKRDNILVNIANSVWLKEGVKFENYFVKTVNSDYVGQIGYLRNVDDINSWVEAATRQKITRIVNSLDPADLLYIINATYFKGLWSFPFDPERTTKRKFNLYDNTEIKTNMMMMTEDKKFFMDKKIYYYSDSGEQVVSLPYGDGSTSMIIILPAKSTTVQNVIKTINPERWEFLLSHLNPVSDYLDNRTDFRFGMPRIKLEYESSLKNVLSSMGMVSAFNPVKADFSGIADAEGENIFINEIKHKTFIEINEEGTEAAAVTSMEMRVTSVGPPPIEMIVDRPYMFFIHDNTNGIILFAGLVNEPQF